MANSAPKHNGERRGHQQPVCYTTTTNTSDTGMHVMFVLFLLSLFLPHRQEGFLELYFGVVLLTYAIPILRKRRIPMPQPATTFWLSALIMLVITGMPSISPADSILTFIRYLEGYCFFLLGLSLDPNGRMTAIRSVAKLPAVFAGLFLFIWAIPALAAYLPQYNGLLAVNGHHPIASYLALFFPIALYTSHNVKLSIPFILIITALIASAARGAWIVTTGFLAMTLIAPYRHVTRTKTLPIILILIACCATGIWLSQRPEHQKSRWTQAYAGLRFFTKDINGGMRLEYARQAVRAFWDSPFTGHGPGTFHLLSRAYAQYPASSGRYAHSFILETLAENGLIGSIPLLLLFGAIARAILHVANHDPSPERKGLAWGVILTMIYGLFDINLNMAPLWNLMWLSIGILHMPPAHPRPLPRYILTISMAILFIFTASYTASLLTRDPARALQIAPYRRNLALSALKTANQTDLVRMIPRIRWFFPEDPDLLMTLALRDTEDTSNMLFERAISRDPYNYIYSQAYVTRLIRASDETRLRDALCTLFVRHTGSIAFPACTYIRHNEKFETYLKHPDALRSAVYHLNGSDGMAKFFYFLGLTLHEITEDTTGTILLWTAAHATAPQWGYYYLETAAAQYTWNSDKTAAQRTIDSCLSHPLAGKGCRIMAATPEQLYPPGTYARDISIIPAIQ